MIGLEAGDDHPDTALEVTELGRARPGAGATVDWAASQLDDLARTLPAKSAVLYYAPLKDRLLGWVITPDKRRMFEQPIDADALAALVRNMDRLIQDSSDSAAFRTSAAHLYDVLVSAAAPELRAVDRLIVVPAGPLEQLPFAALLDRNTGHYLLQDYVVQMVPSAAAFVRASSDRRVARKGLPTVLAIGDPAFDRAVYPSCLHCPVPPLKLQPSAGSFLGQRS